MHISNTAVGHLNKVQKNVYTPAQHNIVLLCDVLVIDPYRKLCLSVAQQSKSQAWMLHGSFEPLQVHSRKSHYVHVDINFIHNVISIVAEQL